MHINIVANVDETFYFVEPAKAEEVVVEEVGEIILPPPVEVVEVEVVESPAPPPVEGNGMTNKGGHSWFDGTSWGTQR